MTNLLANEPYKEVIFPTEIQSNMPVARKVSSSVPYVKSEVNKY